MPTETPYQLLIKGTSLLGVDLNDSQAQLFMQYLDALQSWNEKFNLTAITEEHDIVIKHFLDSLAILSILSVEPGATVVDIGAGAGFPGIPLKIARPDIELTLLESSQKKASFLSHVISDLCLDKTRVVSERAEDYARKKENRENFSLAVSRAVADLVVLVEFALPLLRIGGHLVGYKAKNAKEEVQRADKAIKLLGGSVEEIAKVVIPFLNAERYLVTVVKEAPSPYGYPRRAGVPGKKPLV